MVTPDRRKLAAPVVAQAVSFAAVLVIGALTVTSPRSVHVPPPVVHPSVSPAAAVPGFVLVVRATVNDVALAGRRVTVLGDGTLSSAASGVLNGAGVFSARVPADSYQVCLSVPAGLEVVGAGSASGLPGWTCSAVRMQAGTGTVAFPLIPKTVRKAP